MKLGSLFSGIGGMDLAFERCGWDIAWQVEIDDYCRRVLTKHWPNVRRHDDIKTFLAHANGSWIASSRQDSGVGGERKSFAEWRVDCICGGFPCQPVSTAGKRKGAADDRWLWPEFKRIVGVLRPQSVLVENVPGLLYLDGGQLFNRVLADLAEVGYDSQWHCISAAHVGAPHIRDRVWIVAHASREGLEIAEQSEALGEEAGPSRSTTQFSQDEWTHIWATEPAVGRVANGIPKRVDRLRGLGNAVVPQVVEYIVRTMINPKYRSQPCRPTVGSSP